MNSMRLRVCTWIGVGLAAALPVSAQTTVQVLSAELSVPFGTREGSVVLVGDELVFVDETDTSASFAIPGSNVVSVNQTDQVLTVAVRSPLRNGQREVSFRVSEPDAVISWLEMTRAASTPGAMPDGGDVVASYQAKHDHRLGSCLSQLIILQDRLAFESVSEVNDSRQWVFSDIREVEQDGIYQLNITPFIGNSYNLELIGRGMDSAQYRSLIDKIAASRVR